MPIYDYVLLALLASGGHRLGDAALVIGPDAITQPKGGGMSLAGNVTVHTSTPTVNIHPPKPQIQPLHPTRPVDVATPDFQHTTDGAHIKEGTIILRRSGKSQF